MQINEAQCSINGHTTDAYPNNQKTKMIFCWYVLFVLLTKVHYIADELNKPEEEKEQKKMNSEPKSNLQHKKTDFPYSL